MRYSTTKEVGSTNLLASAISFRANSIYDPDYAILGHNPLGYNQWEVFYDTWIVLQSTLMVTYVAGDNTGSSAAQRTGVFASDTAHNSSAVAPAQQDTWIEQQLGLHRTLPPSINVAPITMKIGWKASDWFNLSKPQDTISEYGSTFGASAPPNVQAFFVHWQGPVVTGGTSPAPNPVQYILEYVVMLGEPKELPSS